MLGNKQIAVATDGQVARLREYLVAKDFIEIFPPHIGARLSIPGCETFDFSHRAGIQGTLAVSASYYLVSMLKDLGRTYSISSSFRANLPSEEPPSNCLYEYRLLQAMREGDIGVAMQLHEDLVCTAIDYALTKSQVLTDDHVTLLKSVKPPFERITYHDAISQLQCPNDTDFQLPHHLTVCRKFGNRPIINRDSPDGSPVLLNGSDFLDCWKAGT